MGPSDSDSDLDPSTAYIRACRLEPYRPLRSSTPSHHVNSVRGFEPHRLPHSTAGGRGIKEENCNTPGPSSHTVTPSESPSLYQQPRKGPRPKNGTYRNTTAPQPSSASAPSEPKSRLHKFSDLNRPSGQNFRTNFQPNDGGAKERNDQLTGGPKTKRGSKDGTEQGVRLGGEAGRSRVAQSQGERPGGGKNLSKKKRGKKKGTRSGTNTSRDTHS